MTEHTYPRRHQKIVTVRKVHRDGDGHLTAVTWDDGWSFGGIPVEHRSQFTEGRELIVETVRLTVVTGVAIERGTWLWRKSDQDLEAEHAAFVDGVRRENEERWEANKADWERREGLLPSPLRRRLSRFRINGGHEFEVEGWGYELTVSELAVLYAASGGVDSDEVTKYAHLEGTSGNQHDYAKILGGILTDDDVVAQDTIANAPSALAPITGDEDYSKAGR
jgi:hypothetical protein